MPLDVAAEVVANHPLSSDYNILVLAAPAIAAAAAPGQFLMVKADPSQDPLLRRPFSVFEIFRDPGGAPTALSLLNKRVGVSTSQVYAARPGQRMACLGPLGRPFALVDPPTRAWMVAGGVGLAPFAGLAEALTARGVRTTLFYGARRAEELFCLDLFRALDVELVLATEDGTAGVRGRVVAPLEERLAGRGTHARVGGADGPVMIYACGPEPMLAATSRIATRYGCPSEVSVERIMGCGLGGCYSCVVPLRTEGGGFHHVRSCLSGPVFAGDQILWD